MLNAQCSSDLCSLLLLQVSKLVVITILKCEFISVVSYLTPGVVPENTRCCCQFSEANILTGDFRRGGFGPPKIIFLLFNKRVCRYKAETPPHHAFFYMYRDPAAAVDLPQMGPDNIQQR